MALSLRTLLINHAYRFKTFRPIRSNIRHNYLLSSFVETPRTIVGCRPRYENSLGVTTQNSTLLWNIKRQYSSTQNSPNVKLGLFQKFKQMYRDYWYVLLPVHVVTSAFWLGSFYCLVRSGVDVIALLQSLGLSEKILQPLKDSSAGYVVLTFALYKLATPLRYAVTVGGTTMAIKHLEMHGYIKPVPSREKIREMIQEKRGDMQDKYEETKQELRQRRHQFQERKAHVMEDLKRYKQEMDNIKKNK